MILTWQTLLLMAGSSILRGPHELKPVLPPSQDASLPTRRMLDESWGIGGKLSLFHFQGQIPR